MATRTVVCPDCSEPLTLGRLSCSNCGTLLASVAGAPRRTRPLRTVVIDEPAWLSDDDSLGWTADDTAGHEPFDDHDARSWQEAVATPPRDAAPPPIVVEAAGGPVEEAPAEHSTDAVLAEPESEPDVTPEPETPDAPESEAVVEPVTEPEPALETPGELELAPEAVAEPVAEAAPEPESAAADAAADPQSSPDVEPVVANEPVDDEAQLSWVDLRVAAVSGADAPAESEASPVDAAAVSETSPAEVTGDPQATDERAEEPLPEESPVEPDVPAADPATVAPEPLPEETVTDEPVGAPGDVDDAAEPPPPHVQPAEPIGRWQLAPDDEPARPLQPSHSTRSRLDLGARPAARADATPAWASLDADESDETFAADESAPAGAWVPPTVDATADPAATAQPAPTASARRSDLKVDIPDDLPTGLTVVGSGVATLGFLLPWAAALPGSTGWTDRWGLAEPSLLLVLLGSAVVLGLNMVPNRVPAWIRAGVLPLGLGGLLLGLVWPGMLGGSGMQLGAVAVTFAAFLLVAGGVVGAGRARHEGPQPAV